MRVAQLTTALATVQHALAWMRWDALARVRTPDGFSHELHHERAAQHRALLVEQWCLQQWLPMLAANDSHHSTGAA